jgi:hypothetical protein
MLELGKYWLEIPPTDTAPGWRVTAEVIDGRYAATKLVVTPPEGKGITRSMLHEMDIHRMVDIVVASADADARDPDLMKKITAPLVDGKVTGDEKLQVIARIYQLAKLQGVPLHQVASELGVHKKTLQRWAQQAENAGFLSAEDRTW